PNALDGGAFNSGQITNTGTIIGFGTVAGAVLNQNFLAATNGTLTLSSAAINSGTIRVAGVQGAAGSAATLTGAALAMEPTGLLQLASSNSTATILGNFTMNGAAVVQFAGTGSITPVLSVGGTFTNSTTS